MGNQKIEKNSEARKTFVGSTVVQTAIFGSASGCAINSALPPPQLLNI
jgi:hypothetical protein